MKKLLPILFLVPTISFAYNICPEVQPEIIVRFIDQEPKIKTDSSAKDLTKSADLMYSNLHVLGKYEPHINTKGGYEVKFRQMSGSLCGKLTKIYLDITIDPELVISKEVMANQCQKDRVYRHEMLHHGFAKEAGFKTSVYANNLARQLANRDFVGYDKSSVENQITEANNQFVLEVRSYMKNNVDRLDKTIDNEENYKNEAKICPKIDRYMLDTSLIKKN